MPTFEPADPDELSLDDVGKFIQRAASVGMMTPTMMKELVEKTGLDIEGIDELDFTFSGGQSRAGESQGTSGTGTTAQSNSATNMDNKSLIVDGDRIIDTKTDRVVNLDEIDLESGDYK